MEEPANCRLILPYRNRRKSTRAVDDRLPGVRQRDWAPELRQPAGGSTGARRCLGGYMITTVLVDGRTGRNITRRMFGAGDHHDAGYWRCLDRRARTDALIVERKAPDDHFAATL